ncbi:restriction system modified-DNA reader domain-containing protein [Catellatospora citrea]|uniref:RAMA domain-containing protein n=1 Tax=Catellatospora citrea TaxID=53366 RepID=A0A8J3KRK1_9ACTN|nr:hypothetical protein [Catellatospora citrea]GIG02109.1 hypothetical protein Cci01nite_72020 [Catellatospora citrea]
MAEPVRQIEIDQEVYAELEKHVKGFERPNDVLRRLLLDPATEPSASANASAPGALKQLIDRGLLAPGDTLKHVQVRKNRTFTAEVDAEGWVKTSMGSYREPSPALAKLVGTSIDGWHRWVHEKTGKTLRQLRDQT